MHKKSGLEINEYQHRGLSVGLARLDEILCEIAQWAEGREIRSVLYHEFNPLESSERSQLLSRIDHIKAIIREVSLTLELTPHIIEVNRRIQSHCSILWEGICELESRRLRRYGEVSSGLALYLDPQIEELIQQVNQLSHIVRG